ncbi:DUF11 domain-containing protein [Streptomyces lavendulae]|uniref:DUF11 domain-containing protein n=1 Tax=Streptomyces lavendulae TaxID=1914 RepID=UPI0036D15D37
MPRTPRKSPGRSRRRTLGAVGVAAAYGLLPLTTAFAAVPAPGEADLAVAGALRPNAAAGAAREHREAAGAVARETYDYVLTVTNRGPSAARQVRVTDRLPASLEFVTSRDGCSVSGRTVTCGPLAALPVGASHSWVITVRLAADYRGDGGDIVNEAVVGADTPDPDGLNNTTSLTGLKIPPSARAADLSLRKTALLAKGREDVRPGEKFTYLITVHNQGPATARQVTVTDRLPSSLALLSSPDDCAVPKGEDRLVVCPPLARLAAGESAEFRITVRAVTGERGRPPGRACAPIENVARVTSASFDPDLSDNANERGTTGPGGGRLCLVSDQDEGHHGNHDGHDGHQGDHDHGDHHGRDDCPDGPDHHDGPAHHGREDQHAGQDPDDDGNGHDGREQYDGRGQAGHEDDHRGQEHHGGRGDLADSGARVPVGLLWVSAALVTGGAALRTAFRPRA